MITLLKIKGEQGVEKTLLANIIRDLSPKNVLISDGMTQEEVKIELTPKRQIYEREISESIVTLVIDTEGLFEDDFENRRIGLIKTITIS